MRLSLKYLLLFIVILSSCANFAMEQEEGRDGEATEGQSPYTLSNLFSLGLNKLHKSVDPIQYATSEESIAIIKLGCEKFKAVVTKSDYQNLKVYNPQNNEPKRAKGDLVKKVTDRINAFFNGQYLLANNACNQTIELEQKTADAKLKIYCEREPLINEAIKELFAMYSRIRSVNQDNNSENNNK